MNVETGKEDRRLKFASGPLKGKPIDAVGMAYRITGEDSVIFRNGSTAKFYVEEVPKPEDDAALYRHVDAKEVVEVVYEDEDSLPGPPVQATAIYEKKLVSRGLQINAFREGHGRRPLNACQPAYQILYNGETSITVTRQQVGTGLREFLFLYETFRSGYGRYKSFCEAWETYFR